MAREPGPNGFGFDSTAEDVTEGVSLDGKTILVTGSNSGIGAETVRVLAMRGAHIIAAARTAEKARAALQALGVDGTPLACELSDLASVRAAVEQVRARGVALDAIICNAGIMALPERQEKEGVELQLYTNHIGHFVLVTGLLDALAEDGRVVVVSSGAHRMAPAVGIEFDNISGERDYDGWKAYGQSKLANILFAKSLARRFEGTKRTANALHPGVIQTNLTRHISNGPELLESIGRANMKSIPQGAATQTFLAAHPEGAKTTGAYFSDCNPSKTTPPGADMALAEALWSWTEAFVSRH